MAKHTSIALVSHTLQHIGQAAPEIRSCSHHCSRQPKIGRHYLAKNSANAQATGTQQHPYSTWVMQQESQNMWQESSQSPLVFTANPQNHFASCKHIVNNCNCPTPFVKTPHINGQQLHKPNTICQAASTPMSQHLPSTAVMHVWSALLSSTYICMRIHAYTYVCGSMYICVDRYKFIYSTCTHGIASTSVIHSTTVTHSYTMSTLDTIQSSATQHHELQSLCESSDGSSSSRSPSSSPPCTRRPRCNHTSCEALGKAQMQRQHDAEVSHTYFQAKPVKHNST